MLTLKAQKMAGHKQIGWSTSILTQEIQKHDSGEHTWKQSKPDISPWEKRLGKNDMSTTSNASQLQRTRASLYIQWVQLVCMKNISAQIGFRTHETWCLIGPVVLRKFGCALGRAACRGDSQEHTTCGKIQRAHVSALSPVAMLPSEMWSVDIHLSFTQLLTFKKVRYALLNKV